VSDIIIMGWYHPLELNGFLQESTVLTSSAPFRPPTTNPTSISTMLNIAVCLSIYHRS
jgi:hypothetical protein